MIPLFSYSNEMLEFIHHDEGFEITFLTAEGAHLITGLKCLGDCSGKVLFFNENNAFQPSGSRCVNRPHYAIEDQNGHIWYSDRWDKIRITDTAGGDCDQESFNSPYTHHAIDITVDSNDIYIATETPPSHSTNGFYIYQDGDWNIYNGLTTDALSGIRSAYRIALHPDNDKMYIATLWDGVWEKDGDSFTLFNGSNSPLEIGDDPGKIRVGGLVFDDNNNLWMSNNTAQNPIVVLREDGTWQNDFVIPSRGLRQVVIDPSGNKWFQVDGSAQGILVFNEGDINNPADDAWRVISSGNSQLPTNRVNCLEVDLDGDVWVGTEQGVVVFECGSGALLSGCQGSRRIVEVDGFNAYLLETENVRTIAVDGANRKWFGTTNGVFVMSPNGEEQIAFFDTDNSPLFDNTITDIAVNDITGEVYIGTNKGMISIRGEAIGGNARHASEVYAFPNPVRPDYDGPIAIKGLARDANVKITDVKGQLVYEGQALGGQAIWDGRDYNGRKAASGVYLVFTTSREILNDPDTQVTKILFMK